MKRFSLVTLSLIIMFALTFNTNLSNAKSIELESNYWKFYTNFPVMSDNAIDSIATVEQVSLTNTDSVVIMFKPEIAKNLTFLRLQSYDKRVDDGNGNLVYSARIAYKDFYTKKYYPNEISTFDYITGIQLSCNTIYSIELFLNDNSKVLISLDTKNLAKTACSSTVNNVESAKEKGTDDIDNYNPFEDSNNTDTNNNNLPTYTQVEELKALIEQLKKELENANNKLQQLENVLNELKPIASNIEQSVSSINDKLDTTNNKLTDINNQLTPSNNKPIQEFNKNVNDLYSNDFVNQPVIENNEIYYQEKELIDLEVPNIPVMDIEEWEGFSIEEEIEKDEIKTKDEIIEMDNFSLDQILPQQNFELDKPLQMPQMELDKSLEMQEFDIQEFQFDTFEKTNQMERDKPLIWGEKP